MQRYQQATIMILGAALIGMLFAMSEPTPDALAQVVPSPVASPVVPAVAPTVAPVVSPAASPVSTAAAPRAGGFPIELAWPLVAGGAAAASVGAIMLRRQRR